MRILACVSGSSQETNAEFSCPHSEGGAGKGKSNAENFPALPSVVQRILLAGSGREKIIWKLSLGFMLVWVWCLDAEFLPVLSALGKCGKNITRYWNTNTEFSLRKNIVCAILLIESFA